MKGPIRQTRFKWYINTERGKLLPHIRELRRKGKSWSKISQHSQITMIPNHLCHFYLRNYGKLTPYDFQVLNYLEPPLSGQLGKCNPVVYKRCWELLIQGKTPTELANALSIKYPNVSKRTATHFMNSWLEKAAEAVWKMSAHEMLEKRKAKRHKKKKVSCTTKPSISFDRKKSHLQNPRIPKQSEWQAQPTLKVKKEEGKYDKHYEALASNMTPESRENYLTILRMFQKERSRKPSR